MADRDKVANPFRMLPEPAAAAAAGRAERRRVR